MPSPALGQNSVVSGHALALWASLTLVWEHWPQAGHKLTSLWADPSESVTSPHLTQLVWFPGATPGPGLRGPLTVLRAQKPCQLALG